MSKPTHHPTWRELTLLAFAFPSEEASGPTRVLDPAGLPGMLPVPRRPSPPAVRRRPHPSRTFLTASPAPARRYRLLAHLGSGGMGTVYKAADSVLGRFVAVKLLHRDDPRHARRLAAEARLLARVDHPRVCKVYDAGEMDGRPYIAMQLVEGPTLRDAWRRMTLAQRLEVMLGVVEGLAAVHRQGLVHRDLKPSNVMVEPTPGGGWRPCLVDFGIAREAGAEGMTATGYLLGTPAYLAPEQVRKGAAVDHRADLYSAGALLYELACGRPPFGDSAAAVRQHLALDPVPPRRRAPGLSPDLERIILRCLEKEPERRYADARALADDLRRLLAGEPVAARRRSRAVEKLSRVGRHAPRAATVAGAAAGLVLALASLWWSTTAAGEALSSVPKPEENYTMVDIFYHPALDSPPESLMALNLKNPDVERLVDQVVARTGESKTEAVRRALEERLERLALQVVRRDRKEDVMRYLEREVWPRIPAELLGKGLSQQEQDEILGYGPDGV